MTRLPFITNDDLSPDQQAVWDSVTNGKRGPAARFINDEGGLVGPFNAALHAPATGRKIAQLGESLRFETSLDNRLLELAISTVGAHWRSNFEWYAHSTLAIKAGVPEAAISAIEKGDVPDFAEADEQAVYDLTRGLMVDGRASDDVFAAAHGYLGDTGMVEIVQVIGYYCLISLTLNTFQIDLPPGETPVWPY